jgi:peptide/nickel transport system substrate-binding protein
MVQYRRAGAAAACCFAALLAASPAPAQKTGGILKATDFDSPASMSPLEEATVAVAVPATAVFNNLVMFDQHVAQNSVQSIVPELAAGWAWSEDGHSLTMSLQHGVTWHDGRPFTAADVRCTWDLLTGKGADKLRLNPRKSWYRNLEEVTTNGDYEVTFHLKRPQPSFLVLLAAGWSVVYPCHVPAAQMRQHPIGTGPFSFVEFKPKEVIRLARNPNYWKPGRPYLDGIEWQIIPNVSTRTMAFIARTVDLAWPYSISMPLLKDVQAQAPSAVCQPSPVNGARTVLINSTAPPFDNPLLRRAIAQTLDRRAFVDILGNGQGYVGAHMLPPPEGIWGMPRELLQTLPGYDPDIAKSRTAARAIMQQLGYGPDKRLATKVSTRNLPAFKDPAVIVTDQLKEIYIDGELDIVDTPNWYPKLVRKDYTIGAGISENSLDDPDQQFYENFACGSDRNYTGYCNPKVETLIERQSQESDIEKRKRLVWEIERRLAEDGTRPAIFHPRSNSCWYPQVKGLTIMVNSIYNGWRMEDVWLDR